jgi:hypothetical protein
MTNNRTFLLPLRFATPLGTRASGLLTFLLALGWATTLLAVPLPPPPAGNDPRLKTPPPIPAVGTAPERAENVARALRENKPELALPFFFPREPFRQVKGIVNPDRYFDFLIRIYQEDLQFFRKTLRHPEEVQLVRFEPGRARKWIPTGKEANALPYWATYRSVLILKDGDRTVELPLRVMITWDGQWYVTHLTRMGESKKK